MLLIDIALKGTALLSMVALLSIVAGHASAAQRHRLWALGLVGLLLLPLLTLVLPGRGLPLALPAWLTLSPQEVHSQLEGGPLALISTQSGDQASTVAPPLRAALQLLPWLWVTGSLILFVRLLVSLGRLRHLARRAEPVLDPAWKSLTVEVAGRLDVKQQVRLLLGRVGIPLTWGWRRPVLLLPVEATRWSESLRRQVLLHELAHVRRGDWVWQLVAALATALHWFNPLAWLALRRLRLESERAGDAAVVEAGTQPSSYARTLVEVARGRLRPGAPGLANPMARQSQLALRVVSLLASEERRAAPRWLPPTLAVLALATIGLLASVRVEAAPLVQAEVAIERPSTHSEGPLELDCPLPLLACDSWLLPRSDGSGILIAVFHPETPGKLAVLVIEEILAPEAQLLRALYGRPAGSGFEVPEWVLTLEYGL